MDIVRNKQKGPRVQIEVSPMNKSALALYKRIGFNHIDTITLSTKLDGDIEEYDLFGEKFFVNPSSAFIKNDK